MNITHWLLPVTVLTSIPVCSISLLTSSVRTA